MNVMTPTKRLRSTWYIIYIIYMCVVYVTNIEEIVALLWSGLGHIHILAMGCSAVENRGNGKGSRKPSYESGGGLFRDDVGREHGRVEDRRTLCY